MAAQWDDEAATFDEDPDHGLRDPTVRAAWRTLLLPLAPKPGARVADLGSGTGSVSVLFAEAGHRVVGVDVSARMVAAARRKSAGLTVSYVLGDASAPPLRDGSFDLVVVRHVLWAMPDPKNALAAWFALLRGGGKLVLVEGRWWTGAGLGAGDLRAIAQDRQVVVTELGDPRLWGGPITDERYLAVLAAS